jgi:hypothetical protein
MPGREARAGASMSIGRVLGKKVGLRDESIFR